MADHAWCHDPARDAAVRAAEDNRTGPLPTLGEAIAAPFACTACGGFGMDHRCKESCDDCEWTPQTSDGMRTERITLELTHDLDARLSDWIVEVVDESLGLMESVRVVEEAHFDDLAQVAMERDAAIRERDTLRAERITQALTADRFAAAVQEADALQARVEELEAASGGNRPETPDGSPQAAKTELPTG
jgi:hypothetical protein